MMKSKEQGVRSREQETKSKIEKATGELFHMSDIGK